MNRIAIIAAAAVLAFAAAPQPAAAQAPPLTPALETCIRSNAAMVERAEASLTDAVRFLTEQLCADQVLAYQVDFMAAESRRYQDTLRRQCDEMRAGGQKPEGVDPMLGLGFNPCLQVEVMEQAAAVEQAALAPYPMGVTAPTNALALAARLILEARLARIGS